MERSGGLPAPPVHCGSTPATTISRERERQTLDGLLMTPLSAVEILFGKWLGCVASIRWGWLWLGAIWGVGVVGGELHPIALLMMITAWWIYAAVLAEVGLWFSLSLESSGRATALTVASRAWARLQLNIPLPILMISAELENPGWFVTPSQSASARIVSNHDSFLVACIRYGSQKLHTQGWELTHGELAGLVC